MPGSENTEEKQCGLIPFKPGESGNPKGRPKGSRNKLGEAFLSDLLADWEENGEAAIKAMRIEKAADYVKVVAATLPRELNVKVSELDELTDDQLTRQLGAIASQLAAAGIVIGAGTGQAEAPAPAEGVPTLQ